jgi:hypothetical protein
MSEYVDILEKDIDERLLPDALDLVGVGAGDAGSGAGVHLGAVHDTDDESKSMACDSVTGDTMVGGGDAEWHARANALLNSVAALEAVVAALGDVRADIQAVHDKSMDVVCDSPTRSLFSAYPQIQNFLA